MISNNLEIVRKVVEKRDESTKKTFSDIINGDDVKSIVNLFLEKMEEQKDVIVQLNSSVGTVNHVLKKNKELKGGNNDKKEVVEILKTISGNVAAIVNKATANPSNPENKKMLKDIIGDVEKDKNAKLLLVAALMGKDVVKNLAQIPFFIKLAKKGVWGLYEVLFGDNGDGGLLGILKQVRKQEKNIKKASKSIELISGATKKIVTIALLLSTMVILAVPAMLGAVLTSAFINVYLKVNNLLLENRKKIDEGSVVLNKLMLGFVLLGISMVLLYKAVEDMSWIEVAMVGTTVLMLTGVVVLLSMFAKPIKQGIESMVAIGLGYVLLSLSVLILAKTAEDMEWEDFAKVASTILILTGVVVLLSMFAKPIKQGIESMVAIGLGYLMLSLSVLIIYMTVKDMEWEDFAKVAGILLMLTGVVVVVSIFSKQVEQGVIAMMLMGAGYILLSVSVLIMAKAVKDLNWEKFGMMLAIIGSMALITAAIGIPVVFGFIALGSIGLALMGIGFISLALGIKLFGDYVTEKAIDKIAEGIPRIINAMTSIFNTGKENASFGDSLMGIVIGALKLGGAILAAGALVFIGIALGIFALCVKSWSNFDKKAIDNIEYAITRIYDLFDLDNKKSGGGLGSIGEGILGLVMAALKFGKTLFQMGTILLIAFTMGLIYDKVMKWKDFDKSSIKNFANAYDEIRRIFKLDEEGSSLGGLVGEYFGLMTAVLGFGKTLFQMGTILLCIYTMDQVYKSLEKWGGFDRKSIDNFSYVYSEIRRIFKLDEEGSSLGGLVGGYFGLMTAVLGFGKTLFQMGTILLCLYTMDYAYEKVGKWSNFDMKSIDNFKTVYTTLRQIFKLDEEKSGIGGLLGGLFGMASSMVGLGKMFFEMGTLLMAVITMGQVYDNIQKWSKFDFKSINNFEIAYNKLRKIFKLDEEKKESGIGSLFKGLFGMASAMLGEGKMFFEMGTLLMAVITMGQVYDNIQKWSNFNFKSLDNFEVTYGRMRKIFKFDEDKEKGESGIKGSIEAMAGAMLGRGRMFFEMGTLLMAVITMGQVYDNIQKWENFNTKSIDNFEVAYERMRKIFKFDEEKESGIKGLFGGITSMTSAMLEQGKTFYEMGTLLMAVITMSQVYDNIKKWENFNFSSIDNFKTAYNELRTIFKFDEEKESGIKGLFGGITSMASAMLEQGKTFYEMGTILAAVITMSQVYDNIKKWENFNIKSIDNFEVTYERLRKIFKFDEPRENSGGFLGGFKTALDESLCALADKNKTFNEMATVMIAVKTMSWVYDNIKKWENFNEISLDNFGNAYIRIRDIFKFDEPQENSGGFLGGFMNSFDEYLCSMADKNKTFNEMATIVLSVKTMSWVYDNIKKWESFNDKSIENFENALFRIKYVLIKFGLSDLDSAEEQMGKLKNIMKTYSSIAKKSAKNMNNILIFNNLINVIKRTLSDWNITEFEQKTGSITWTLDRIFNTVGNPGKRYRKNVDSTIKLFNGLRSLIDINYKVIPKPFTTIIDKVNRLDIEKATTLTDMFKSFSKIKEKNIFSSFEDTVEEFTQACIKLVDAINGNTDALNSDNSTNDSSNTTTNNQSSSSNENRGTSVRITNIDELAQMIAQKIGGVRSGTNGMSIVDLRINGQGGDQWVIRKR